MKQKDLIKEIFILSVLLFPVILMFLVWNKLPDKLPIHWNIKGEADSYGPKYLFALINTGLYLIFLIIPRIDPRKKNYTIFSSTYYKLRFIFTLFFSILFSLIICNSLYSNIDFEKIIPASILFLIALIGNYLGIIRSNYFVGIRTPWTLNNEKVWKQTHVFGSRILFYGGIFGGIVSIFISKPYAQYFAITLLIVIILIPAVYSYFYYKKLELKNQL
jgi:uncharacterized membrane protein